MNPKDHAVIPLKPMMFPTDIGQSAGFDISWVDQSTGQYFLADGTHQAIAWFNATNDTFVDLLAKGVFSGDASFAPPGPPPNTTAGCLAFTDPVTGVVKDPFGCNAPDGVVTDDQGRVWAGNAPTMTDPVSNVVVIDPATRSVVTTIDTGGHTRSDELSFDPVDHMVLIANPDDGFLTWISTTTLQVVGKFFYSGNGDGVTPTLANHPAPGGLEQSVFDPRTGLFYQAVPGVGIDVFQPVPVNGVGQLVTTFALPGCTGGPTGLVVGPHDTLIGACSNGGAVVELHNGHLRTIIPNVGGADEVWFNPGDDNAYFAQIVTIAPPVSVLGVANAKNDHFVQSLPSGPVAHSVAAYQATNQIFVPAAGEGILVYQSAGH